MARIRALLVAAVLLPSFPPGLSAEDEGAKEPVPKGEDGAGKDGAGAKPAGETPDPEFKKDSSREEFAKGKALFAEGKYKEAEALFKKVKADAKAKEDKDAVETWTQSAAGLQLVDRVKAKVSQNQLKQALQDAEGYARKFKGTPAEEGFRKLIQEIESKLVVPLEEFNTPSGEYTEKYGKTFVNDPAQTFDGTPCLRWQSTQDRKAASLKILGVPDNWTKFEAVEFWVNVKLPPGSPEAVIVSGDPKAAAAAKKKAAGKKRKAEAPDDIFLMPIKLPSQAGQWQKVRLPLAEFKIQADATLSSVLDFRIQVAAGKQFDLLIDKIVLVRKEGAPAAASAPEAKKKK